MTERQPVKVTDKKKKCAREGGDILRDTDSCFVLQPLVKHQPGNSELVKVKSTKSV